MLLPAGAIPGGDDMVSLRLSIRPLSPERYTVAKEWCVSADCDGYRDPQISLEYFGFMQQLKCAGVGQRRCNISGFLSTSRLNRWVFVDARLVYASVCFAVSILAMYHDIRNS